MLATVGASTKIVDRFREQAEIVIAHKSPRSVDEITVSSGFGQTSQRGFVELTLNDTLTQMDVAKAREVGLMLINAAEAAASDEMFVTLLGRLGLESAEDRGRVLVELREIRQGTRGISYPS